MFCVGQDKCDHPEIYGRKLMRKFEAHLESQWETERCRERGCGNPDLKKEIIFPGCLRGVKTLVLESVGRQAFCEHRAHLYSVTFTWAWEGKKQQRKYDHRGLTGIWIQPGWWLECLCFSWSKKSFWIEFWAGFLECISFQRQEDTVSHRAS